MDLVDTHAHLYIEPLSRDVPSVLARARQSGVGRVVVPANDLVSWQAVDALADTDGVSVAYGLHPWVAGEGVDPLALAERLRERSAVAVGEIGLDFAIAPFDRDVQLRVLRTQLEVAADLGLPVLLHCRKAFEDLMEVLRPFTPGLRGVLHAFSRGPELAERFVSLGLHLGFGGTITRANAAKARRAAAAVGWDRIVLETDAPSIGLEGIAATNVEPHHLLEVARALAGLRSVTVERVAERTTHNARALLGLA